MAQRLEAAKVRKAENDMSSFPTSSRPVFAVIGFLFVSILILCISARSCGSDEEPPPPAPEKVRDVLKIF